MVSHPNEIPAAFATAFNARNIEGLLALYHENALLVPDGKTAIQGSGIRGVLEHFLSLPGSMSMKLRRSVVGADEALVVAEWSIVGGPSGVTSDVVRRGTDGKWRYVIDAPFGITAE